MRVIGAGGGGDGIEDAVSVLGVDEGDGIREGDMVADDAENRPEPLIGLELSRGGIHVPGTELGGIEGQSSPLVELPRLIDGSPPVVGR